MQIIKHLKNRHLEALKAAVRIHTLTATDDSCIYGRNSWKNYCQSVEEGEMHDELMRRYHLAEHAAKQAHLNEEESLQLALDICLETGISHSEFELAREYNRAVRAADESLLH
ncbi:MAG: hypothetical protein P8P30_05805 [Rickettsiales bacterium]|nr:hypothetical protein [Rickettsiales bacterium]